jgi:hypothetical protein
VFIAELLVGHSRRSHRQFPIAVILPTMNRLLAFLTTAFGAFSAGIVTQSGPQPIGNSGQYALTLHWTGDPVNGSVPVTVAQLGASLAGLRILQVETVPGTPAPTNGYNVKLIDSFGGDLMSGALSGLSSATTQFFSGTAGTPPIMGDFSLSIAGQSVPGAQGSVVVYIGLTALVSTSVGVAGPAGPQRPPGTPGAGISFAASAYIFTPQTPGVSLASGNNSITMTPVPQGVNGTDILHYLYVSGGTGTAEACLITGGTGTAGSATGQIIIQCPNTHTGPWTIQTATAGIQEAIEAAKATGGGAIGIDGFLTIYAPIVLPDGIPISIHGGGIDETTIFLADGANCDVITNENFSTLTGSNTAPAGIYRATLSDFTIDGNKAAQSGNSWGLRVYGHGSTFRDLVIQNGLTGDLYSEYAFDPSLNTTTTDLEDHFVNLHLILSGGKGLEYRGPHDSYFTNIEAHEHSNWCMVFETDGATYNGDAHLTNVDTYNCSTGSTTGAIKINGVAVSGSNVVASTAFGDGLYLLNAQSVYMAASVFAASAAGAGLVVNGGNNNILQGIAANTSDSAHSYAVNLIGGKQLKLDLALVCGAPACININSDLGQNQISGVVQSSAGPLVVGTMNPTSRYELTNIYSSPAGFQYLNRQPAAPTWNHYHVAKIADGTDGCSNGGGGCWQVNGGTPIAAASATTQTITLDTIGGSGSAAFVSAVRIKTSTAFTGTISKATATLGNTRATSFYYSGHYNLMAAVSSSNFTDAIPRAGSNIFGAQAIVAALTTSGANMTGVAAGSAFDVWFEFGLTQ